MLKEQIQKEINDALKSGDKIKRLVLGMLLSSAKNREIIKRAQLNKIVNDKDQLENQSQLNDEEILETIASEVKKRKEAIEQFNAGNRQELARKEKIEMDILLNYLPAQLSEEEIKMEVKKILNELDVTDIKETGKVIGKIMTKLKGRADGGLVSRIVKEELRTDR